MPMSRPLSAILPQRVRCVPASFAWIDRRLREQHVLSHMTSDELALYVFLVLAADRDGLSCWRLDRMERELPSDVGALARARSGLVQKDLVAFSPWSSRSPDGAYQVLAMEPSTTPRESRGGVDSIDGIFGLLGDKGRR